MLNIWKLKQKIKQLWELHKNGVAYKKLSTHVQLSMQLFFGGHFSYRGAMTYITWNVNILKQRL